MLKVCGKVVYVKSDKVEKTGRHYKRLQLLSIGGGGRAQLYDVTDMANCDWKIGAEVEVPCSIDVYQGKRGLGFSLTHWGGALGGSSVGDSVPSADGAVNTAKQSGGKFGG